MKTIFESVELKNLSLKNRLVRSATWEGIAAKDGGILENAYEIYRELAKGGVGAIITGFTSVADSDSYFGGMMRLSRDELIPQYKKLVDIIHAENVPVIAQLALGAYYRPLAAGNFLQVEPNDMTVEEIREVVQQFSRAALRAAKAGFDGVQIHAAHFFFLSRFISPAVNRRGDDYGGDALGRSRILRDILRGIKHIAPGLHVTMKINSNDFNYGGLGEEESLLVCRSMAQAGLDSVEVSGNGTSVAGIRAHVNEGYFAKFAARLAEEVPISVILVGGLRSKEFMERVLNQTKIELLSLSRPLLCEPDFPRKLASGESTESKCVSCNACYSSFEHRCVFRK